MFSSQDRAPGGQDKPTAIEVHGVPSSVSLRQLRDLFSQVAHVLQVVAALDASEHGVALIILASERAATTAVELFDGYPLDGTYLHVKRADSLPNSLVNLLYSLEQPSSAAAAETASAQANAAANAYLEQQQQLQVEQRRARQAQEAQQQAWDAAQQQQRQQAQAAAGVWAGFEQRQQAAAQQQNNGLAPPNGHLHLSQNGGTSFAKHPSHQQQLESDLRQLQLDHQHLQQQQQNAAAAAAAAAAMPPPQPAPPTQPQRPAAMSWASAAAAAPSLAALVARPPTAAATLAAATVASSGSGAGSEDWQTAAGGRGRTGRRSGMGVGSGSLGRAGSSVSSGSPQPANRSSGRRSEDKLSRPGGQDGASAEPTTKLWMGGIDGSASAETVRGVFGRFGPIFDYELQPATHEKGRTDQWGFVNFKRLGDANRAYETLVGEVIPELTGTRKLKLQFRPVDNRRASNRR